eukprot:scaffold6700_cov153-Skeletonema_menzelii.AAC.1
MASAAAAIARMLVLVLFWSIVTVASARTTYAPVMLNAAIILSARGHVEIVLARASHVLTMASAATEGGKCIDGGCCPSDNFVETATSR